MVNFEIRNIYTVENEMIMLKKNTYMNTTYTVHFSLIYSRT